MPSNIVLAHRAYHSRGLAEPAQVNWQQALVDLLGLTAPVPPQQLDASHLIALYHQTPELDFGRDACRFCRDDHFGPSKEAERRGNATLKERLPSLQNIEWMDWFSPSHLGVSRHFVGTTSEPVTPEA
jgi:hypothetical protein